MFQLVYRKQALKGLRKMPPRLANRFIEAFEQLAQGRMEGLDIRALSGRNGYRLRIGEYRAIYTLDDDRLIILVLDAGPRGDIYK
jgi:mRNA interferase RelE/StbE